MADKGYLETWVELITVSYVGVSKVIVTNEGRVEYELVMWGLSEMIFSNVGTVN